MSGKSKQQIRMTNLLEKSHHINAESLDDPTIVNYLRLLEVIITEKPKKMSYYLSDLEDKEESKRHMQQLDENRKHGIMTECEYMTWLENLKKKQDSKRNYRGKRKIKVINPAAGTEEIYPSINAMCEEYGFKKTNIRTMFNYRKSDKIKYKGLILEKI